MSTSPNLRHRVAGPRATPRQVKPEAEPIAKVDHGRLFQVPTAEILPSPENDTIYHPADADNPDMQALAQSIRENGIKEPLVLTLDKVILSGHRRHFAAEMAGLKVVPCRFEQVHRAAMSRDDFVRLLREYNRQRSKSLDEILREEIISTNPQEAYEALLEHRRAADAVDATCIELREFRGRKAISRAKWPMIKAIQSMINERREYWPLSDRQVHYSLLNNPPLRHASKPDSTYRNDLSSYRALTELLTRARLAGLVPWAAIHDETRPVTIWDVHASPATFLRRELDNFLGGYRRDFMRSQPSHLEIVGEKNTIQGIIRPVAARFRVPLTIGRGYCSLEPRRQIARRYFDSGKDRLKLLILSDFDPDGEEIAHSLARSLRDDFGVWKIDPVKVALTAAQVRELNLPPILEAKEGSSNYGRFVDEHGTTVFELEAVPADRLQAILTEAIDAVINQDLLNAEIDAEKQDAAFLADTRKRVERVLASTLAEG